MGKWGCSLLLLLATAQVQAAWQCQVKPQDDIIISAQQVQIVTPAAICRYPATVR